MENKSGALILLIMLIVSAFVILMVKLAAYIRHFNGETRRIIMKMQRAADEKEYCYWHKMLRCHYLCLIPFVNERNVSGAYSFFFHQPKRAEKETRIDGVFHILAPSLAAFCLCAVCLCGASWAWFTASTSTGTTAVQSSSYRLSYRVDKDAAATELDEAGTAYTLTSDTTVITLKAIGTAGATGYCSITVGSETYYTEQISVNGTSEFTFTVNAAANTQIILTPKWGTYSHDATLHKGEGIPATGSQQSNTQAPDNTVTAEPSTEPAPTTPTVPTTPSSTPAESATTAPEPSATAPAPTQPESTTDTEPTPASEETTADPPEAGAREENGSPGA